MRISSTHLCLFLTGFIVLSTRECPPKPKPQLVDGTSYVVRFESPSGFLKVGAGSVSIGPSDADASFVLFDLNRGELRSGDEVLLLSARDSYLKGSTGGSSVIALTSASGALGGDKVDFCNNLVEMNAERGGQGTIGNNARVQLRLFKDPCKAPSRRSERGFISVAAGGVPKIVTSAAGASETFVLHIDRAEPYSITRNLSAPFANPDHFNAGNLMDLDWHKDVQRNYLGGSSQTYDDHTGIDFGWPAPGFRAMQEGGVAVLAVAPGKVVYVRDDRDDQCHREIQSDGTKKGICPSAITYDTVKKENEVIIRHDDGTVSVYAHLMKDSVPVNEGDRVECGQLIGRVGSSGGSDAPHLHFELRRPHDPDFWTKNPNSVKFPHFWDHSMIIDPYEIGAWKQFRQPPPNSNPDYQFIPIVTCQNRNNRRLAREGEDNYLRSQLARGYLFDWCETIQSRCGQNYYCGSKGFCERRLAAGDPCTNGNQCPPLHGCQNGICRLGPNCTNRCLPPCFLDGNGQCMKDEPETQRVDCTPIGGVCGPPCFLDGDRNCKRDRQRSVRKSCQPVCVP